MEAKESSIPTIVVVFRSRLRPDAVEDYAEVASFIAAQARKALGLRSVKTFTASDGERVTLADFEDENAVALWREQADHRVAQKRGREDFYQEYHIQVCQVMRSTEFVRGNDS